MSAINHIVKRLAGAVQVELFNLERLSQVFFLLPAEKECQAYHVAPRVPSWVKMALAVPALRWDDLRPIVQHIFVFPDLAKCGAVDHASRRRTRRQSSSVPATYDWLDGTETFERQQHRVWRMRSNGCSPM